MRIILFFFLERGTATNYYWSKTIYILYMEGREENRFFLRLEEIVNVREREREHQSVKCGLQEFRN